MISTTTRTGTSASTSTDPYLDDLAHLIAANGIGLYESDIARLVVRFRAHGLDRGLVDLLADHATSTIVRERAFGVLVGHLARGPAATASPLDAAA